jgi:hypothetical protein
MLLNLHFKWITKGSSNPEAECIAFVLWPIITIVFIFGSILHFIALLFLPKDDSLN